MPRPTGVAFLLSQVGAHVAHRFAERLRPLDLTPSHVAVLRQVATDPGLSQQTLAARVGAVPSRMVKLLDELEARGLVERRRSKHDRRHHEIHLAPDGTDRLADVRRVVAAHDAELVLGLTADEVAALVALLSKVADAQGLSPGVHPGTAGRSR